MSYFRDLCLLVHSGVQHILCCVFVLFVFVLCTQCCQFFGVYIIYIYIYYRAEINTLCHLLNNNSKIENKSSLSWKQHRTQTIYCHVYMNVSIIVITALFLYFRCLNFLIIIKIPHSSKTLLEINIEHLLWDY
jgi:hypothetical protein